MAVLKAGAGSLLLAAVLALCPKAGGSPPSEYEVKAAFLCNFAEFVDWPGRPATGDVTIGVLGGDPFGRLLEETAERRPVRTKQLKFLRLTRGEDALACQILYVAASEKERYRRVLRELGDASILTVSDIEGFARGGGIIEFRIEQSRVRFDINQRASERVRLRISSTLLKLARIVSGGES